MYFFNCHFIPFDFNLLHTVIIFNTTMTTGAAKYFFLIKTKFYNDVIL